MNSNAAFVQLISQEWQSARATHTRPAGLPVPDSWPAVHIWVRSLGTLPGAVSPVRTPIGWHRGKSSNMTSLCPAPQARMGHLAWR